MSTVDVVASLDGVERRTWTVRIDGRPAREALDEIATHLLEARREGFDVELRGEAAACVAAMLGQSVEVLGQTEEGEQPGVEEVVVPDDPVT